METSYQFPKVPVFRRNKASDSSTSKHPFFQRQWRAEWKPLYLVIYSRFLDLPSHLHEQFSIGDNEKNKAIVTFFLHLQMVNCPSECGGESKKVELITKYKGFYCRWEMDGWDRITGVSGFNSPLKCKTAMLTTLERFSYMVYFCFVKICLEKRGINTK